MAKRQTKKQICKRNKDIYDAISSSVNLARPGHQHADVLSEEFCGETWMWWLALVETDQIHQYAQEHPEILTVNDFLNLCGRGVQR